MDKIVEILNYYRYPYPILYFIEKFFSQLNESDYGFIDFISQKFDLIDEVYYTLLNDVSYEIENKLNLEDVIFELKNENIHCQLYLNGYDRDDIQEELDKINKKQKDNLSYMAKLMIKEVGLKLYTTKQERLEKIKSIDNE